MANLHQACKIQNLSFFRFCLHLYHRELSATQDYLGLDVIISVVCNQVLLSQVHRLRALDLLGRFLDLGPWAVHLVSIISTVLTHAINPVDMKTWKSTGASVQIEIHFSIQIIKFLMKYNLLCL